MKNKRSLVSSSTKNKESGLSFVFFLIVGFVIVLTNACVTENNNAPVQQQPVSAPAPAQSSPNTMPSQSTTANSLPVTLPLVDAMLADPDFVNQVKSTLQLNDEQILKLQEIASAAVSELDEKSGSDDARSTVAAAKKAEREIKDALGNDKGSKFIDFIQQQTVGMDQAALLEKKPNAVPTDTRIVVNAPAYRMDLFKNGQLIKSYGIGIGYPEFPLPSGIRKADKIIFNPKWTPPDEPWVKGKYKPGKTIEAGSKDNPLGPIKIPIGLPSLIHGGKTPARIGTFASHGCVGLTTPQIKDIALQISSLTGSDLTPNNLNLQLADKTATKEIKLKEPIPVELRYETIIVENGKLRIYRDVYERGTNTEENLRRTLEAAGISFDQLNPLDREEILKGLQQMAYNAVGKPVEANSEANSNDTEAKKDSTGEVTKNIKGKKEVVFELAELKGKGYPSPINLSSR